MFLLGFGVFLLAVVLTIRIQGGMVLDFIDPASLLFILLPLVAVLVATKSFQVFYGGLRAVIFPNRPITEELRGQAATLFRFLSKTMAVVIFAGVLIGFVNLLMVNWNGIDASGVARIGINIVFMLTASLHGLFWIAAVFEPVVFILKKRRGQ